MYIIIKHIPKAMTLDQLEGLIRPIVQGKLFEKKGQLKALKILRRVFRNRIEIEHHALVRVCSDPVRKRLIRVINNNTYSDPTTPSGQLPKRISASVFVIRHHGNDRRIAIKNIADVEKRGKDRREFGSKMIPIFERTYVDSGTTNHVDNQNVSSHL